MQRQVPCTDIIFEELTYSVNVPKQKEKKRILKGVTGAFKSGQLSVIMGPSGAGKSTLLNVLTGFITNGVGGAVQVGEEQDLNKRRKICSYIQQDDNLFPWFTVKESMMLAANLKIGKKSHSYKQFMVDNILENLHLEHTGNTPCSNLSGGQKKRLSIALELLDNPPVLFLDEPTSGLDSSSSKYCVQMLSKLAREGHTIICTIHQPSASEYELFDHVYVMADGHCIYQGSSTNTVPYLDSLGLHCPNYHSPADYIIEVAHGDYGDLKHQMTKAATDNRWRMSQSCIADGSYITLTNNNNNNNSSNNNNNLMANNNNTVEKYTNDPMAKLTDSSCEPQCKTISGPVIDHPSEWVRLWVLICRCQVQHYRDWTVTHLKLLCHIVVGILVGLFYGDSGTNATKSISNIGFLLIGVVYLWYTTMMPSVLRFPSEITVLRKETFNHWYKLRTYYLATIITSTPIHILFATIYCTITFFMTDQPVELERYIKYLLMYVVTTIAADAFGIFLGTLTNPVNGTFFGAISTCFMLIFSGFLVLFNHMPDIMKIVSLFSFKRYSLEGLVLSLYDNNRPNLICPEEEIYCHYRNPKFLIDELGMKSKNYCHDIMMMSLQLIFLKVVTYFSLKRRLSYT